MYHEYMSGYSHMFREDPEWNDLTKRVERREVPKDWYRYCGNYTSVVNTARWLSPVKVDEK